MCVFLSFFFSSRRRHTRLVRDWSSDVCSSDLEEKGLSIEPMLCLAEDLIPVLRTEGESGFSRRIAEEVAKLEPDVDSVLLS